jgi:indole-3-glycerol phosphate synthase
MRCSKVPIISEIKFASPSRGLIRERSNLKTIAEDMRDGGAVGISVLTEPTHFLGRLEFVSTIRDYVDTPILMKDIILSTIQIDAALKIGASSVLLIQALYTRGYSECDIEEMINYAHSLGLEVLLEAHSRDEFESIMESSADLVGINNRNLRTLEVDLNTSRKILFEHPKEEKIIVTESGIDSVQHVQFLHNCGAKAFLIGTYLMESDNIRAKVEELVDAI